MHAFLGDSGSEMARFALRRTPLRSLEPNGSGTAARSVTRSKAETTLDLAKRPTEVSFLQALHAVFDLVPELQSSEFK